MKKGVLLRLAGSLLSGSLLSTVAILVPEAVQEQNYLEARDDGSYYF